MKKCLLMLALILISSGLFATTVYAGWALTADYDTHYETGDFVYGPCGDLKVKVHGHDYTWNVVSVQITASSVPGGMQVRFTDTIQGPKALLATVTNPGKVIDTRMHIRTYNVNSGDYTVTVRMKVKNAWGQVWYKYVDYDFEVIKVNPESLNAWSANPSLIEEQDKYDLSAFWWTLPIVKWLGGSSSGEYDSPPEGATSATWEDDERIYLYAEDEEAGGSCDCAAATLHVDNDGLEEIRVGDIKAAFMLLNRHNFGSEACYDGAAGNIINLWVEKAVHTGIWRVGFDTYFETEGLNCVGFVAGQREWQPSDYEKVYSCQLKLNDPVLWMRNRTTDGDSDSWVINLKTVLDRCDEYIGVDTRDHLFYYVEPISESFSLLGDWSGGNAWQRITYFKITGLTGPSR